jgi:hypothetical protein
MAVVMTVMVAMPYVTFEFVTVKTNITVPFKGRLLSIAVQIPAILKISRNLCLC